MSLQLSAGEHALFEGHPSWRATLAFYLQGTLGALVLAGLVAAATAVFGDGVALGLVVIVAIALTAVVLVAGYVRRMATTYTITNRRLHIKRGIVARRTQEARLERVQNVNTEQSVIERLMRVGAVDFDTAGTDDHGFRFDGVSDPTGVVQAVDRAQREFAAESHGGPTADGPGTAASGAGI